MDEQVMADAYAKIHMAMRGLHSNLISAREYLQIIREIRMALERKQCEQKKAG